MFCLAWQVKRRWCRRYCVERPLRASPFEVAYVHPSVLYRVAETKGTGRTELWVPSFPLSLSVFLACCRPFLSFSLSFFQHAARRYSAYIRFAGWIDACVHALSSQRDDWWENSISVVVIVPPSSAQATDHPRWLLAFPSPSPPLLASSNETKPSLPSLLPARLISRPFRMDRQERARARASTLSRELLDNDQPDQLV